jgi:OOP family OmpA-OmpF porin
LLYRVEQAYLISRENGLLIEHVHHAASKIKDSDAVSAMFTAIQDFVKESFSPDRTGRLESADMGEFTLWAVHGPHALLVCVIRGVPPKSLRSELSAILERIHFRYGDAVRKYAGDTDSVPGVDGELQKCLDFQATQGAGDSERGPPWPLIILAVAIFSIFAYLWFNKWTDTVELDKLTAALNETPGLYIASTFREGDQIRVHGMRDPLALSVLEVAENNGILAQSIIADMKPFQSLETEIVERRVEQAIGDLDSVSFDLAGSVVTVTGEAPGEWIEDARGRLLRVPGVQAVDLNSVVDSDVRRVVSEIEKLSGTRFLFDSGTVFGPGQELALRAFSRELADLSHRALSSGYSLTVTVIGSTDAAGGADSNSRLALRRAEAAATVLSEFGVSADHFKQADATSEGSNSDNDPERRNVSVNLSLAPPDSRSHQ